MAHKWRIHPHDPARVRTLERAAGISAVAAQLLICRGITDPDRARSFLNPVLKDLHDPELLPGAAAAADLLIEAVGQRRKIVIYGDYDVDGMSGTALLVGCLKLLSADVGYYVPNRIDEGYGLNAAALRQLAERGCQVVVTVDCGIASVQEAAVAAELGLDLIITDHHTPGPVLPAARAIVHPTVGPVPYPFAGLCGAGVAFKLAWVLCQRANRSKRVSQPMRGYLLQALALVALGTVADVVPLVDENRAIVRHGLDSLKARPLPGIAALATVARLAEKPRLSSEDIAFALAPRLNAAGRLGQAMLGVELLTTTSAERATTLAEYLHELNASRESLERSVYLAANKQAQEQCDASAEGAGPGRTRLASGRDRHCRRAIGREISSARDPHRPGRTGGQAGCRLGPGGRRLRSSRHAQPLLWRTVEPWRARDGRGLEDRRRAAGGVSRQFLPPCRRGPVRGRAGRRAVDRCRGSLQRAVDGGRQ